MKSSNSMPVIDQTRLPMPFVETCPEWTDLCKFAWRLASTNIRHSRGRLHMDAAWDSTRNYQWVWDTCFMALFCRYGAGQFPGIQSLDNFYELQRKDGYISMTYDMNTGREPWPDRINPPLFAWVEWEYYRTTGDASRIKHAIKHIERLMKWIDDNRLSDPRPSIIPALARREKTYRLYYFEDCGSSGMDNSPRTPRQHEAGRLFDWVDLSSQMALSFQMLSRLHRAVGNTARSRHWSNRASDLGKTINNEMWCARTRFYHDRIKNRNFVASKTAAGFWPILAGICPESRLNDLVAHLENPNEFKRPTPVPTLSADDPNYSATGGYWLGGVWAPTNYMITRGLMLNGKGEIAHSIACRYIAALARTRKKITPHTLWEAYSPEHDSPASVSNFRARVKPHFVGWTGIGPTAMFIENIIGVDVNALNGVVTWDLRLTDAHGIRCLPLPGGSADISCKARKSANCASEVSIKSSAPVTFVLRRGNKTRRLVLKPGVCACASV